MLTHSLGDKFSSIILTEGYFFFFFLILIINFTYIFKKFFLKKDNGTTSISISPSIAAIIAIIAGAIVCFLGNICRNIIIKFSNIYINKGYKLLKPAIFAIGFLIGSLIGF